MPVQSSQYNQASTIKPKTKAELTAVELKATARCIAGTMQTVVLLED
jgi:hypothetical protein